MDIALLERRLHDYHPANKLEELNAFKEILQELALAGLSRADFFSHAAFMGGTSLRILHGLQRFSEDLDFSLKAPSTSFSWTPYLQEIRQECLAYGLDLEVIERAALGPALQRAFLKHDSFGQILQLTYPRTRADSRTVRIRLEIDTNPPAGARFEAHVLPFPLPFSLVSYHIGTLFAGKLNALFTRGFAKGRDWFDLAWYLQAGIAPNASFLVNALAQFGIKAPRDTRLRAWIVAQLQKQIATMDWRALKADVENLLRRRDQRTLDVWDAQYFQKSLARWLAREESP